VQLFLSLAATLIDRYFPSFTAFDFSEGNSEMQRLLDNPSPMPSTLNPSDASPSSASSSASSSAGQKKFCTKCGTATTSKFCGSCGNKVA
jgi:hypothetical protein